MATDKFIKKLTPSKKLSESKKSEKSKRVILEIPENASPHRVVQIISDALIDFGLKIHSTRDPYLPSFSFVCEILDKDKRPGKIKKKEVPDRELTYEERVEWFVANYYETGMELRIMLDSLKNDNLDKFKWYDEIIRFPKTTRELNEFYKKNEEEL
ncbi:MAG: hypothetical protein AABY15_07130 [Nanoarchaeota archaeon]